MIHERMCRYNAYQLACSAPYFTWKRFAVNARPNANGINRDFKQMINDKRMHEH
jgi:hypothetical protein